MPKLSTIDVSDAPLDEKTAKVLNEIFPKKNQGGMKHPRIMYVFLMCVVFVVLSLPFVDDLIFKITPSFQNKSYLSIIVKVMIFGAIAYIALCSNYFKSSMV